ncbi:serine dehydratase beta chain [Cognaticolwellia mytili]|uniref:serine dehydratase beta chain n=1 Tax=Cognaticolwellia mytili TaxID=1888913 RepID=UPI000A1725C7|nr:serine dehydratase beta chain [Cognaticolwellia mytili]
MAHSIFDLFKANIELLSSYTSKPMIADNCFIKLLTKPPVLTQTSNIQANPYNSLALTGKSHTTDIACTLSLIPQTPDLASSDKIPGLLKKLMFSLFVDQNKALK